MIDPRRNSTYKRPFTQEGNYLVYIVVITLHIHPWYIGFEGIVYYILIIYINIQVKL